MELRHKLSNVRFQWQPVPRPVCRSLRKGCGLGTASSTDQFLGGLSSCRHQAMVIGRQRFIPSHRIECMYARLAGKHSQWGTENFFLGR